MFKSIYGLGNHSKGEEKIKDSVRTSETAWLMNKEEPLVAKIRNRVAELVQLPMSFAEDMQVCAFTLQTQTRARALSCVCRPSRAVSVPDLDRPALDSHEIWGRGAQGHGQH